MELRDDPRNCPGPGQTGQDRPGPAQIGTPKVRPSAGKEHPFVTKERRSATDKHRSVIKVCSLLMEIRRSVSKAHRSATDKHWFAREVCSLVTNQHWSVTKVRASPTEVCWFVREAHWPPAHIGIGEGLMAWYCPCCFFCQV
jgi:hypothetical protein